MNPTDLAETLHLHRLWRAGDPGGQRANLADANLADANLADAYLADAYLAGAALAGANLADAYLADANLAGAALAGANLADANLADANLADAYLACANLAGANLACANLAGANLAGANLAGANLAGANLTDANLEKVQGVAWWQGGCYGPRRRMIRVHGITGVPVVLAGRFTGTADEIVARLTDSRHSVWVRQVGQAAADRALAEAVELIAIGVESVRAQLEEASR